MGYHGRLRPEDIVQRPPSEPLVDERGWFERWSAKPSTAVVLQLVLIVMLILIFAWAMFRASYTTKTNQLLIAIVCEELVEHRLANQDDHDRLLTKHGLLTAIENPHENRRKCTEVLTRELEKE